MASTQFSRRRNLVDVNGSKFKQGHRLQGRASGPLFLAG